MINKIHNQPLTADQRKAINDFLDFHPDNTLFQSPDFYNLYLTLKNFRPQYFLLYNDENVIVGLLLAVTICEGEGLITQITKRCVIQGGPIVKNDNPAYLDVLLKSLNHTRGSQALITQFRNYKAWDNISIGVFKENGFDLHDHLNLIVQLNNNGRALEGISASRRRQIRKGLESGATLKPATGIEEVKELYTILQNLYNEKVKKPLPQFKFFAEFYNQLVPLGKGIILLVYFEGKIIGGIVCPITPGKMMYELYICGLYKEYPHQYPSVLATWAALDWANRNNVPAFDFLGLGRPGKPYGVRDFKLRFGGEKVNYGRFGRSNYPMVYALAEMGYNILKKLKRI